MATLAYRLLNVFARGGRLTGNPLCVFEDGRSLDDTAMQDLARQFNLSDTTFILPSERADARVRIFTPAYEMPFAGHPTLGSAHVVRALRSLGDAIRLEMKAGIIPVEARGDRWTFQANAALWREATESRSELAEMFALAPGELADRPLWVNAGTEQLMVPLTSAAAVARARPLPEAFARLRSTEGPGKACVFADDGDASASVTSRFFFPGVTAIIEDPATGSACANLGGWFCALRPGESVERVVSQGDRLGRPSTLRLSVKGGAIFVGGDVIELGRGVVEL